jgi:VanZ family protein
VRVPSSVASLLFFKIFFFSHAFTNLYIRQSLNSRVLYYFFFQNFKVNTSLTPPPPQKKKKEKSKEKVSVSYIYEIISKYGKSNT